MESLASVARGVDFDDSAHLPPVLRRNAGGVDAHRLQTVGFNLRSIARRSIVGERNSIEHELRLVFRPAGMEHRVAFVEPPRLGVHQVLQRTAWERRHAIVNRLRPDLVDAANALGIDKGAVLLHLYGCLDRNQSEFHQFSGGSGGANLNGACEGSKSSMANLQKVHTKREPLDCKVAGVIRSEEHTSELQSP